MLAWVPSIRQFLAAQALLCLWASILGVFLLLYAFFFRELEIDTFQFHLPSGVKSWSWDPEILDRTRAYELRWRMLWGLSALSVISVALLNAFWSIEALSRYEIGRSPVMWLGVAFCVIVVMYVSWLEGYGGGSSDRFSSSIRVKRISG
jgi:hypothetical protein